MISQADSRGNQGDRRSTMDLGLKDKVAVVTASSKGLGKAAAETLAQEGARLAICSRDGDRISETGNYLQQTYSVDVLAAVCDVSDPESVAGLRDKVLETYGGADIVFANAGGPPPGGVQDVKPADYEQAIQLNLMSAIHLAYAFLPQMKERQWGRIIASTSIVDPPGLSSLAGTSDSVERSLPASPSSERARSPS
jgi:3-oxoacyl-[acyl-carrier protein] reductase